MGKSFPDRFFSGVCSSRRAEYSTVFTNFGDSGGSLCRSHPGGRKALLKAAQQKERRAPRVPGGHAPASPFPLPEQVYLPFALDFRITAAQTEALSCWGSSMSFTCSMMVPTSSRLEQSLAF